jgi:hypothetical protein
MNKESFAENVDTEKMMIKNLNPISGDEVVRNNYLLNAKSL